MKEKEKAESKLPFCAVNVTGWQHLKTRFGSQLSWTFCDISAGWHLLSSRKKKKSFKLCWTLNDNHAISLKGFLWHFYVSINVNKVSEIHSRGPCVVSWHCLLATSCPFMSSVLAELSPSCFLSLSVSICRFAQTHSNKKSFFFLPTPPKSLL